MHYIRIALFAYLVVVLLFATMAATPSHAQLYTLNGCSAPEEAELGSHIPLTCTHTHISGPEATFDHTWSGGTAWDLTFNNAFWCENDSCTMGPDAGARLTYTNVDTTYFHVPDEVNGTDKYLLHISIEMHPPSGNSFVSFKGPRMILLYSAQGKNYAGKVSVQVVAPGDDLATSVEGADLPHTIKLAQNYPNPFNPSTGIEYGVTGSGHVHLAVYDLTGRTVAVLVDGVRPAGHHAVRFNADGLPTGPYIYRLTTGDEALTRIMVFVQ